MPKLKIRRRIYYSPYLTARKETYTRWFLRKSLHPFRLLGSAALSVCDTVLSFLGTRKGLVVLAICFMIAFLIFK